MRKTQSRALNRPINWRKSFNNRENTGGNAVFLECHFGRLGNNSKDITHLK